MALGEGRKHLNSTGEVSVAASIFWRLIMVTQGNTANGARNPDFR